MFWFHCGRCGSLFRAKAGDDEDRICLKCGSDPSTGIFESPSPVAGGETMVAEVESRPELEEHRGKRSVRKRKSNHLMLKLVGGWSLVLALIVIGARKMYHVDTPDPPSVTERAEAGPVFSEEDRMLLEDAGPKCAAAFSGFLAAGVPEQRNQFVLAPVETAARMARFHTMNPMTNVDPQTISLESSSILVLPSGKAIETLWSSSDGKRIDAVFREESSEWRLDWDHFARYGEYPWPLFLAGSGESEGEFRLLARERLAEERKDADTISIVLYGPRFGRPEDTGIQSPEFLVSRRSKEGMLLDAGFKLARQGRQVFGSRMPRIDPDGMIRVWVKVKRSEVDLERKFEITKVLGCHWYSEEDPGVVPVPREEETAPLAPGITPVELEAQSR